MCAGTELTPVDKAVAAWLWSGRIPGGAVRGRTARLALDRREAPAELNQPSQHKTGGIVLRTATTSGTTRPASSISPVTTPERTAFDLERRRRTGDSRDSRGRAAAGRQTQALNVQPLLQRLRIPGIVQLRRVLELADDGAESPRKPGFGTVFTDAGMEPTQTQIEVFGHWRELVGRTHRHGVAGVEGRRAVRRHSALIRPN